MMFLPVGRPSRHAIHTITMGERISRPHPGLITGVGATQGHVRHRRSPRWRGPTGAIGVIVRVIINGSIILVVMTVGAGGGITEGMCTLTRVFFNGAGIIADVWYGNKS